MRKLLQEIGTRLQAFTVQRNNLALVLRSPASDSVPILKLLEGIEEDSTSDLFWCFTEDFEGATSYAAAIAKAFATRHEAIRLAMCEREMTPWPAIPESIMRGTSGAAEQLRELAAFSRELLPVKNGGNNIWMFYPLANGDPAAFAGLMKDVLQHDFPFPWCHHLRFIVRDDPADLAIHALLAGAPRIDWYEPDLGMDAVNRSLEQQIADESLPLAERMAALPIMAGNDFAAERYPQALEKYELLLRYHAPMNNHPMAAFALNGMGEVFEKTGDFERANDSYEAALIPASHGESPAIPIFLNVVVNLANLCMRQSKWLEAEAYYDMAQQLATIARNPTSKISALDNRGICQAMQGDAESAAESWHSGAAIAAQVQDVSSCRVLLGKLEQHYSAHAQESVAEQLREQLAALGSH